MLYFYRTASGTAVTNFQRNVSTDGSSGTNSTYQATTMAGTNGTWTIVQQPMTSGTSAATPRYGIGVLRMNGASAVSVDIDDYVLYAGAADNTAPNSPGSVSVGNPTTSSLDVSWAAASGGVDGGGYVVVRYSVNPNADNDPNQNGIYAVGNTHTNGTGSLTGTIRYIGTGTSFTDNVGLNQGTTYYYKVYTVDKAFNYSAESQGSGTTAVPATPTFIFTGTPLSAFSTSFGVPSAEQVYTISGINLTINQTDGISVTAPADFEVSLTSATYTGTNGNTVTLSTNGTGNIVGEPVNIYVRYYPATVGSASGNIAHSGAGVSPASNIAVSGVSSGYFYSKSTGDLTDLASWGTATDGTGSAPADFTSSNQTFEIRNRTTATITADWIVSGASSKIIVGSGVDFTIPSTNIVTGKIDVQNGGELTLANTTLPTLGTLATGSTVEYAQTTATSILNTTNDVVTYANLKLSNSGLKTFKGSTTTVNGNIIYDGTTNGPLSIEAASASPFTTINLAGNMTYLGTVTNPADADSYTLVTNGTGPQTITGNGNTARFFRITNNTAGNNVILSTAGGSTNALVGNATSGGIALGNATATLSLNGNTLTFFAGATTVTGAGTITGSSVSNIVINSTSAAFGTLNFTSGSRSLNNLTISNTAGVTLGTALDLYGTLSLTSASLNLNAKNLTLKSNATGTARIANLTGSTLTGATNVTMERYIKLRAGGDGRAYRLLAPTVNTSGSINASWMEGGMNTAVGTNIDPVPGYGTQITGSGGNANGFDKTLSNAPSLYTVANGLTPTYTAVTSTSGTLNALTGYFLYVRGDRNQDMTLPLASNMPTSATTLRTTGSLVQGTQTTFTNPFAGAGALNLVTNPYPSPIDWNLVYAASSNITPFYTFWDPNFGTRGGFVTVSILGVASSGAATQYIQPGQAFFVEALVDPPVISIQEAHKAAGNNNDVFLVPPPPVQSFRTELYYTEPNGFRRVADGVTALYGDGFNAAVDGNDAKEIGNWDENIAISRNGKRLAIESRPVIGKSDDLPLYMNNMKKQAYEFEFTPAEFTNTNLKAELVDNFLGTRSLLSVTAPTVVRFTVTDDPASAATDRFKIVFGQFGNPTGVDVITIKAAQAAGSGAQSTGVQVDWSSKTETDMSSYEVERQAYGTAFVKMNSTAAAGNSAATVNYSWLDANPVMGTSFYRIRGTDKAGNTRYSETVRVLYGKGEPAMVVYPNPLPGSSFTVDLYNLPKGTYLLSLYNNMGQLLYSEQLQHDGSQASRSINPGTGMGKGTYQLQLSGSNGFKTTQKIVKN
ncbi:MAG: T9SS type A sorting domain-containing protein [Ferruginibacter sp.]